MCLASGQYHNQYSQQRASPGRSEYLVPNQWSTPRESFENYFTRAPTSRNWVFFLQPHNNIRFHCIMNPMIRDTSLHHHRPTCPTFLRGLLRVLLRLVIHTILTDTCTYFKTFLGPQRRKLDTSATVFKYVYSYAIL